MSAVEQLYSDDIIEIILDLPFPPSMNELWAPRRGRGKKLRKSDVYTDWIITADSLVMARRQYPKRKIGGAFEAHVKLSEGSKADADNCAFKAVLDWCQSRDLISNDKHCRKGSFEYVPPAEAPEGCRITLRSLPG